MSSLTYTERFTHPTTADVMANLNWTHCNRCNRWATRTLAWRDNPNTPEGRTVLDAIGQHFIENNIGNDRWADIEVVSYCVACGDVIDYCLGHGEIGDRAGWAILQQHYEHDIHDNCDPHGCDEGEMCPEGPCAHPSHS